MRDSLAAGAEANHAASRPALVPRRRALAITLSLIARAAVRRVNDS